MKKLVIISSILLTLISGSIFALSYTNNGEADVNYPELNKKVNEHETKLENHEARITNTESDVKVLQANTNTPPSSQRLDVPAPAPAPTPTEEPAEPESPKVVTAVKSTQQEGLTKHYFCDLSYSDNSSSSVYMGNSTDTDTGSIIFNYTCDQFIGSVKA